MRTRRGRSVESLVNKLAPPDGEWPIRSQVKRPTVGQYARNKRLTPEERIDRAFALLAFASSLRKEVALHEEWND